MSRLDESTGEIDTQETVAQIRSLHDELRSHRRWHELLSLIERQRLLADIAYVALAIGRDIYPDRDIEDLDVGRAARTGDTCPRERLAFLSAAWSRLSRTLDRLEASPPLNLAPGERTVSLERGGIRNVLPSAVLAALRTGDLVPAPSESAPLAARLGGRLPRRITERVAVPTHDSPENRAVKAILVQLARDLSGIATLATQTGARGVAEEAETLRLAVRRHLCRAPWDTLPLTPRSAASVATASAATPNPMYRVLFDFWRRYRHSFAFDWSNPLFTLPARETWQLYEIWCLLSVADALQAIGYHCQHADGFALIRLGLTFSLSKGRTAGMVFENEEGRQVTLTYSPNFSRADASRLSEDSGHHSRSHTMRPDIALEANGAFFLLDAKFKTYAQLNRFNESALLPDIHQMHAYRDAIRDGQGERLITGAWLLFAGRKEGISPAVIAYPKATQNRPFGNGDVGGLLLRPGGNHTALRHVITAFLEP